ncbi:MAG TPA: hypothetical protein VNX87_26635 [Candidatus Sulfotelmatobacter sp.]|nr:hypothetical protein [Candidatus Sulfotelmatobacter sp.]
MKFRVTQDRDVCARFSDFSARLYAIHLRHREVHQYEVGEKLVCLFYGIGTIHGFATNLPI